MVYYKARLARPDDIHPEALFIVPGLLALGGDLFVICTWTTFEELRRLRHINIMFLAAVANFLGSLGVALGPVPTGSPGCWFQGLTSNFCYAVAAAFYAVYAYDVFTAVHHGTILTDAQFRRLHLCIWFLIPACSLLPLAFMTYGNSSSLDQYSWCFLTDVVDDDLPATANEDSRANLERSASSAETRSLNVVLDFVAFYAWIYGSMAFCVFVSASVILKTRNFKLIEQIYRSVLKMLVYPIILAICWFPAAWHDIVLARYPDTKFSTGSQILFIVLPVMNPFFIAVALLCLTQTVQKLWFKLLSRVEENVEERASEVRISFMSGVRSLAAYAKRNTQLGLHGGTNNNSSDGGSVRVDCDSFEDIIIHHRLIRASLTGGSMPSPQVSKRVSSQRLSGRDLELGRSDPSSNPSSLKSVAGGGTSSSSRSEREAEGDGDGDGDGERGNSSKSSSSKRVLVIEEDPVASPLAPALPSGETEPTVYMEAIYKDAAALQSTQSSDSAKRGPPPATASNETVLSASRLPPPPPPSPPSTPS